MTKTLVPLLAYGASVFISWKYFEGHWVVGAVFGAAFLIAQYDQVLRKFSLQQIFFVVLSTLIYALVYQIAMKGGWKFQDDWLDMLAGTATVGILVGSILMPTVHAFLFGTDSKTVRSVSVVLALSWYVVIFVSWLDQALHFKLEIPYMLLAIALWQGIYFKRLKLA